MTSASLFLFYYDLVVILVYLEYSLFCICNFLLVLTLPILLLYYSPKAEPQVSPIEKL